MRGDAIWWRVWDKFAVGDESGCWNWLANRTRGGYGLIHRRNEPGLTSLTHRIVYEIVRGPIPEGLDIDHRCRNRGCVNPFHLEPVTGDENNRRGESFSAENARKTHCPRGHLFDVVNQTGTRIGKRRCRACAREATRAYRQRQRAATT